MESKSLNKFISESGYCSRREADQLILDGRVVLNGAIAHTGNRYVPGDIVEVDGSIVKQAKKEKHVYIALNKPVGITTTTELQVPDNIISFINYPKRIFPVGRLDKDSEGLIFLTNDGDIVNKILRASYNHEKEYIVRVNKACTPEFIRGMASGVPILDTVTKPCKVSPLGRQTFKIVLTQGLNRQIRRMTEHFGYKVTMLQRVRILHVKLDKLAVGKWRYLNEAEVGELKYLVEVDEPIEPKKKIGAAVAKSRGITVKKSGKDDFANALTEQPTHRKSTDKTRSRPVKTEHTKSADSGKMTTKASKIARTDEWGGKAGKVGAKPNKMRKDRSIGKGKAAGIAPRKTSKAPMSKEKSLKEFQPSLGYAKGKQQKINTSRSGGADAKQSKSSSYKDFKNNPKVKANAKAKPQPKPKAQPAKKTKTTAKSKPRS